MALIAEQNGKPPLLINRNFALLWAGQTISSIGDFFFDTTCYLWIVTQLAKGHPWTPLAVSGLGLAVSIPTLCVGPLAGVFVDRWNKRQTLLRMDALRVLLLALLLITTFLLPSGSQSPWELATVYVIVTCASVCSQFFGPSQFALIGTIVPQSEQSRASGFSSASFNIALIMGPALAAPLYFTWGPRWAIAIDAISFLASWAAVYAIKPPVSGAIRELSGKASNFLSEFFTGWQVLRGNRQLVVLLVAGIIFSLGTGASNAFYTLFALENLHAPHDFIGFFAATYGAAVILGSLILALVARRIGEANVFYSSLMAWGIVMLLFARSTHYQTGLVLFALLGLANAGINVVVGPLTLRAIPPEFRGRIRALFQPTIVAASMLSATGAGVLTSTVLHGMHLSVAGITYGPLNLVLTGTGILSACAGLYAYKAAPTQLSGVQSNKTPELAREA